MKRDSDKVIYLRSLGCNKNTVDSEVILTLLKKKGYRLTQTPEEASRIIVNTCAFIDDAKEEAIDNILELSVYKKNGAKLIVSGCLPQLYHREILNELPEVDAVVGIGNLESILDAVNAPDTKRDFPESREIGCGYREYGMREELLTLPGYAYVKISEGCSMECSFCLIPKIKGKMRSRLPNNIVEEVRALQQKGIQEVILTSQDTLYYGRDLGIPYGLKSLIEELLKGTNIRFIRTLYLRPSYELFEYINIFKRSGVLPYFDIPIQHVSKNILLSMRRVGDYISLKEIITKIRHYVPEAIIRTTVIVGFPGETEEDFNLLLHFIEEVQFNHLGVFTFSPQRETEAYALKERVPKRIAEERKNTIFEIQREISRRHLRKEVDQVFDVLIEERFKNDPLYLGRSYHFAPEVDGVFLLRSEKEIKPGSIVRAKVTSADDYDLHGVLVNY